MHATSGAVDKERGDNNESHYCTMWQEQNNISLLSPLPLTRSLISLEVKAFLIDVPLSPPVQPQQELLQSLNPQSGRRKIHLTPLDVFSSLTFYTSAQGRLAPTRERTPNDLQQAAPWAGWLSDSRTPPPVSAAFKIQRLRKLSLQPRWQWHRPDYDLEAYLILYMPPFYCFGINKSSSPWTWFTFHYS